MAGESRSVLEDAEFEQFIMSRTEDGRVSAAMLRISIPGVATLTWETESGEVYTMRTEPRFRRQGHMSRLWRIAGQIRPVRHSPWRTADGDAFARAIGGDLPPLMEP